MQASQEDNYKLQIPKGDSFKNLPASYHLNRLVDVLAHKDGGAQAQVAQKCGSCSWMHVWLKPCLPKMRLNMKRAGYYLNEVRTCLLPQGPVA